MVAHNHPQQDLTPSSGVSEDSYSVLTYINKINLLKKKNNNNNKRDESSEVNGHPPV
jgi:DNA repair protein RadC